MSSVVIEPIMAKGEQPLPPVGILAVNPSETSYVHRLARERAMQQRHLFNSQLYSHDVSAAESIFCASPAVGSPMAVMVLEKLIALGARQVILYGWCGSLSPALAVGDLLVPTWALSEEGVSQHYPGEERSQASATLRASLLGLLQNSRLAAVEAPIWTTDAVYRETREKVRSYAALGILAVDMEYSALCRVAAYRGIAFAALMLVSDSLCQQPWRPGYANKKFRKKSRALIRLLMDRISELAFKD